MVLSPAVSLWLYFCKDFCFYHVWAEGLTPAASALGQLSFLGLMCSLRLLGVPWAWRRGRVLCWLGHLSRQPQLFAFRSLLV